MQSVWTILSTSLLHPASLPWNSPSLHCRVWHAVPWFTDLVALTLTKRTFFLCLLWEQDVLLHSDALGQIEHALCGVCLAGGGCDFFLSGRCSTLWFSFPPHCLAAQPLRVKPDFRRGGGVREVMPSKTSPKSIWLAWGCCVSQSTLSLSNFAPTLHPSSHFQNRLLRKCDQQWNAHRLVNKNDLAKKDICQEKCPHNCRSHFLGSTEFVWCFHLCFYGLYL